MTWASGKTYVVDFDNDIIIDSYKELLFRVSDKVTSY